MMIILLGEGKEVEAVNKYLIDKNHKVNLIRKLNITDNNTDFVLENLLLESGVKEADVIIALTSKDSYNLAICQISKLDYNIKKTFAKVNNPDNMPIFKALGVTEVINIPEIISQFVSIN